MTWCRGNGSGSPASEPVEPVEPVEEPTTTRRVGRTGKISFAAASYPVGVWLDGETVEVSVANGLVSIHHRGVLVATHAQRHRPAKESQALARKVKQQRPRPRQATVGQSVTRKVDSSGNVVFAGTNYRVGRAHIRRQVQVAIVGEHRRDLRRRRSPQGPPDPPRPLPRARRLRQRRRPTLTHQRRLTPHRSWNTATGAKPEHGYRDLTRVETRSASFDHGRVGGRRSGRWAVTGCCDGCAPAATSNRRTRRRRWRHRGSWSGSYGFKASRRASPADSCHPTWRLTRRFGVRRVRLCERHAARERAPNRGARWCSRQQAVGPTLTRARARGTPRVVGAPSSRRWGRTPEPGVNDGRKLTPWRRPSIGAFHPSLTPGSPTVVGAPDRQRWDARLMASLTLTCTAGQAAGSGSWTSRPSPSDGRRRVLAVAKGAPPVPVPGPSRAVPHRPGPFGCSRSSRVSRGGGNLVDRPVPLV